MSWVKMGTGKKDRIKLLPIRMEVRLFRKDLMSIRTTSISSKPNSGRKWKTEESSKSVSTTMALERKRSVSMACTTSFRIINQNITKRAFSNNTPTNLVNVMRIWARLLAIKTCLFSGNILMKLLKTSPMELLCTSKKEMILLQVPLGIIARPIPTLTNPNMLSIRAPIPILSGLRAGTESPTTNGQKNRAQNLANNGKKSGARRKMNVVR